MQIQELGTYRTRSREVVEIERIVGRSPNGVVVFGKYTSGPRAGNLGRWLGNGLCADSGDPARDIVECIVETDDEGVALNAT